MHVSVEKCARDERDMFSQAVVHWQAMSQGLSLCFPVPFV